MPDRPFRITYVDDDVYNSVASQNRVQDDFGKGRVLQGIRTYADEAGNSVEFVLGPNLEFMDRPALALEGETRSEREWSADIIRHTDVLVLDLAGMGRLRPEMKVTADRIREIPALPDEPRDEELQILNESLSGAGFLIANRDGLLRSCQHIILLTKYDQDGPSDDGEPGLIHRYVHPLCNDADDDRPWATMGTLSDRRSLDRIVDQIRTLHQTFTEGFTRLTDLGAIELAAVHDDPVLIVGETGTGKEYVARNIHRRWAQEKFRRRAFGAGDTDGDLETVPFVALNCSLLDPEIGRTELFGAVQGTYSSLEQHRLGAVLRAAGLRLGTGSQGGTPSSASPRDFRDRLLQANGALLEQVGGERSYDLALRPDARVPHTYGVLFLDELAELPRQSQSQLLRLLQSMEVSPLGYPGRIYGLKLRILAATNDAQVAALAGHELRYDLPRSDDGHVFRGDLISRLKGQVIKTTPVTQENVEAWVRHFTESVSEVEWTEEATAYFIEQLKAHLESMRAAQENPGSSERAPFFGNRREVQQVVDRAATYVQTARQRGIRTVGRKVTKTVVERVWRPSSVQLPHVLQEDATRLGGTQTADWEEGDAGPDRHDREQARALYDDIEQFLREHGHPLSNWRTPEQLDQIGPDQKATRDAWRQLRRHVDAMKDDAPELVESLWTEVIRPRTSAAQREAAFGVHRSTVSKLFNQ